MTEGLKPILTGYCNPSNPPESHAHCPGEIQGHPCSCGHHDVVPVEVIVEASPEFAGIMEDLDEEVYHAHPGSLSVSGAKTILKAPALFKHQQTHRVYKKVFDFGSAAHAMVLGVGAELRVLPAEILASNGAASTGEARAFIAQARADGAVALKQAEYDQIAAMANQLANHPVASRLLAAGRAEVSAFAVDPETGVMRRGRADFLSALRLIVDYKTADKADPHAWAGKYGVISKLGYDLQAEWYLSLFRDCGEEVDGFCWIVQEKEAPYIVTVIGIDEDELTYAAGRNRIARQRFRDCTESGIWPGYIDDREIATVSLTEPTIATERVA
jgi:hypothetical protein